jgi:Type I phosphodiesterase / nucleotide pyrophosphatase
VSDTPVSASLPATRKAILVVIDGLTPAMFEDAVERRTAPTLAALHDHGEYRRATTVFPSLTPVCLSSLVTGAYPDVHEIPHLVWYHRGERRVVEYGSSFAALRRAGTRRAILDAIFRMNEQHLARDAVTLYEATEDAGLVAAAVNIICYRGRTPHVPRLPGLTRPAHGPQRFFYFNLFESDETGAPFRVGGRHLGSNDRYAAAVGRWLVTRDGFDLLVYYLPDYDYASHAAGPDAAHDALARSDAAVGALVDAAGGIDALLERYDVILCSDHGQTRVTQPVSLQRAFTGVDDVVVTASNRAGMVYDLRGGRARELAERLDGERSVETALFLEDGDLVARRDGAEGSGTLDDYPDGRARALAALRNPNAGDVLVSAAPGFEFTDLAGRHHAGGGSHGSLDAGDSEVPLLAIGTGPPPARITDVAPLLLDGLGVERPAYARALSNVG